MSQIRVGCTVREACADPTELEDTIQRCDRDRLRSNRTDNPWVGSGWNQLVRVRVLT
jgi:hypothetical protein